MDLDYYFSERRGTRRVIAYVLLAIGLFLVISAMFIGVMRAGDSSVSAAPHMVAAVSMPVFEPVFAATPDTAGRGPLEKVGTLGLLIILPLLILLIIVMLVVMRIARRMARTRNLAKPTTYVDAWAGYRMPPEEEVTSSE